MDRTHEFSEISPTAFFSAHFRRYSGLPYAAEIAEASNAETIARELVGDDRLFEQSGWLHPSLEARHRVLDQLIEENQDHSVLHLGCALMTQGLTAGVPYLGLDLPEVILARERIFKQTGIKYPDGYQTQACNVLDGQSLERAVSDCLPGERPILVIHEGLLHYFNLGEKDELINTLTDIGRKYGVLWGNIDVSTKNQLSNMLDVNEDIVAIVRAVTGKTGRDLYDNAYENKDEAIEALTKSGFERPTIEALYTEGKFPIHTLDLPGMNKQHALAVIQTMEMWNIKHKKHNA